MAEGLARAGLVTLLPISADLNAGNIYPSEIDALVRAFETLEARPEVDPARIGFIALSVGGGLAMCAVADPRIRERVAFVSTFGGYFDARDLFVDVISRTRDTPEGSEA